MGKTAIIGAKKRSLQELKDTNKISRKLPTLFRLCVSCLLCGYGGDLERFQRVLVPLNDREKTIELKLAGSALNRPQNHTEDKETHERFLLKSCSYLLASVMTVFPCKSF